MSRKVTEEEKLAAEDFAFGWVRTYFSKERLDSLPQESRFTNRAYLVFGGRRRKVLPPYKEE